METFSIMFDIDKLNIYWNEFKDTETVSASELELYNKYVNTITQLGDEPISLESWMSLKGKKRFEAIDTNLLIKLSGKNAKEWIKSQKKNVLYSRLLELEKQILLHPDNAHHLFMPVVDDIIASTETGAYGKIYVEVEGNPASDSPDLINSLMPHTQVKNGIIFVKGKFGVGIVALAITGHSTFQADSVEMNKFYNVNDEEVKDTMLRFEGLEDNYSLNNYIDNEGNIISEFLSQLLTTQVDNVKNPVGIKLGINNQTLNVVEYLNRRGVGPETIIAFIKQPLIQEYLVEQRINESVLNKSLDKEVRKLDLISKILKKHFNAETIKQVGESFPSTSFINKQNLINSIKNKNFDINQIYYFNYFLELLNQSKFLSDFSQEQTADTKAIKNKTGYENVVKLIDKSTASEIIPLELQSKVRTSGVIAPFTLARENYFTKFKDMYITNDRNISIDFNEYKNTLIRIQKTNSKKEKVGVTFENDLILYFAMKYVLKNIDPDYYNKLFGLKGHTSLAERIIEAKNTFENNIVINAFLPLLKSRQDEVTNDYLNNLRLFEREINNSDMNDLINSTKEIAEQDYELFRDIVVFSLIQSGFNNSPFNYLKVIPQGLNSNRAIAEQYEYIINDIVSDAVNAIYKSIADGRIEQDINQYFYEFQRNNPQFLRTKAWKNYPLNFTIGFEKGKMKLFSYNANDYKEKEEVAIYGSTYHKRYGLSYDVNIIIDPNSKMEEDSKEVKEVKIIKTKSSDSEVIAQLVDWLTHTYPTSLNINAIEQYDSVEKLNDELVKKTTNTLQKIDELEQELQKAKDTSVKEQLKININSLKRTFDMIQPVINKLESLVKDANSNAKQLQITEDKPKLKVISGGQTGIDRLGLEVAKFLDLETGGTTTPGFITEKGKDESLKNFGVKEISRDLQGGKSGSEFYLPRTEQNVINSDGTVYFATDEDSAGKKATEKFAKKHNKPFLLNPTSEEMVNWIQHNQIRTLNIAGNRGSKLNDIQFSEYKNLLIRALGTSFTYKTNPQQLELFDNAKQLQTTEDKVAERMNEDFDSLFPQYEYFTKEQKQAASDVVANNETSIECKFTPGKGSNKFGR